MTNTERYKMWLAAHPRMNTMLKQWEIDELRWQRHLLLAELKELLADYIQLAESDPTMKQARLDGFELESITRASQVIKECEEDK